MQQNMASAVNSYTKGNQRRKVWQRIVSTLICIVVFCTTYALILPAITMSSETSCGLAEHAHTDECYDWIEHSTLSCTPAHTHTEECCDEDGALICGMADFVLHEHDESCYDADGELICQLEERVAHTHTEECYSLTEEGEQTLICELEELEEHSHTEECYDEDGSLVCDALVLNSHQHTESCFDTYTTQGELICEDEEHIHTEECYENFPVEMLTLLLSDGDDTSASTSTSTSKNIFELTTSSNETAVSIIYTEVEYDSSQGLFNAVMDINFCVDYSELNTYSAFHITLPKGVFIAETELGKKNVSVDKNRGNQIAFDWWFEEVDGSYVIHIQYRDDYKAIVNEGETTTNELSFEGLISKENLNTDGSLDMNWSTADVYDIPYTAIEYPDNETSLYDVHTEKTGSYSIEDETLTYTVKVYTEKGTPSPLKITDVLTANGVTLDSLDTTSLTIKDSSGNTVTANSTNTSTLGQIELELPGLAANDYYEITYTYKLDSVVAGSQSKPSNTVTATAEDTTSHQTVTNSSTASVLVDKEMVEKSGSYDSSTGLITWTIVVNPDGDNIAGYTLSDDMMKSAISLSVSPSTNRTVDYDAGTVTFIGTGDPATNTNTYTIVYTTKHDQTTADTSVTNTATLKDPTGNTIQGNDNTATAWVPKSGGIDKQAGTLDASTGVMDWTVNVTIPSGGIAENTVITDEHSDTHWMTQEQIYVLNNTLAGLFPEGSYKLEFSSNWWYWVSYEEAISDTSIVKYYCWRVTFTEDLPEYANQTIAIHYTSSATITEDTTTATYVNKASMSGFTDYDQIVYKKTAAKLDKNKQSGETNVTSKDGVIGWYILVRADGTQKSISVTDFIPDGLTVTYLGVGGEWACTNNTGFSGMSGTVTAGWDSLTADYTVTAADSSKSFTESGVTYSDVGYKVDLTITDSNGADINGDVYVYIECKVNDLENIALGSSKTYTFANKAIADGQSVAQTQVFTIRRPDAVVKMDKNGATGTSTYTYSDGTTLGWYVEVYLGSDTTNQIKIEDTLPSGLTLTKIGFGTSKSYAREDYRNYVTSITESATEYYDVGTLSGAKYNYTNGTVTVTTDTDYAGGTYLYLYLECTIDGVSDKADGETLTFANNAVVTIGDNEHGEATQTQNIFFPKKTEDVVDKNSVWDDDIDQIQYAVLINQKAADLNSNSGTISVTDVMSYTYTPNWRPMTATLISSSVKLYYAATDASGNVLFNTDGTPILGDEVPTVLWSWTYGNNITGGYQTVNHTITAEVPDKVALVLCYAYEVYVDTEEDTELSIWNSATVTGDEVTSDAVSTKDTWEISSTHASTTTSGSYTIYKVKAGNYNVTLPGAVYTVYTADGYALMANGSPVTYTSDEDGVIRVARGNGYYEYNVLYYIQETEAPDGYTISQNNPKFYFYFGSGSAEVVIPDGVTAVNLGTGYSVAYLENEEAPEHQIAIDKTWLDADGNALTTGLPDSIAFHLIQTDSHGNTEHFLHGVTQNGIRVYEDHSVVWTATLDGYIVLNNTGLTIYDLKTGNTVAGTVDSTNNTTTIKVESGIPYQIVCGNEHEETSNGIGWYYTSYALFLSDGSGTWTAPATSTVTVTGTSDVTITDSSGANVAVTYTYVIVNEDQQRVGFSFSATEGETYTFAYGDSMATELGMSYVMAADDKAGTLTLETSDWTTSVVVPEKDSSGNDYIYTVEELAVSGYSSDVSVDSDGDITITNRKTGTTSITVEKDWSYKIDEDDWTDVKIHLYQSVDTRYTQHMAYLCYVDTDGKGADVYLDSSTLVTVSTPITGVGQYTLKWNMADWGFYGSDADGAQAIYIEIVDPNFDLNGYTVKIDSIKTDAGTYQVLSNFNTSVGQHDAYHSRITLYNIFDGTYYMDTDNLPQIASDGYLEVTFTLTPPSTDTTGGVLPAINALIPTANTNGTEYRDPITLTSSNSWSDSWTDLPLSGTDSSGNIVYYSYYVQEEDNGLYNVVYSEGYAVDGGTITVYNLPEYDADLTVDKKWLNTSGETVAAPENQIQYTLESLKTSTIFVSGGWGWSDQFAEIRYYEPGTVVTVELYACYDNSEGVKNGGLLNPENYDSYTWDTANPVYIKNQYGTCTFCKLTLVRTIKDTDELFYFRVNTAGLNWGTYDTYTDSGGGTKKDTKLIAPTITVDTSGVTTHTWKTVGTFTLSEANNWARTHEHLPATSYRLVETTTGYTTTYYMGNTEVTPSEDDGKIYFDLAADDEKSLTIKNVVGTTSIYVDKVWLGNGEDEDVDVITFTLYQADVNGENGTAYGTYRMTRNSNGTWSTLEIDELPDTYPVTATDGTVTNLKYTYYVEEYTIDGFTTSYSDGTDNSSKAAQIFVNGDGKLTIINEASTSIGVTKTWVNAEATKVRVELWRYASTTGFVEYAVPMTSNGDVDYASLTASAAVFVRADTMTTSKTFKNLPLYGYNADGTVKEYYTYFIVEVANGYTKTYGASTFMTSGRYAITNTAITTGITVEKNWLTDPKETVQVQLYQVLTPYAPEVAIGCAHESYTSVTYSPTCTTMGYTLQTCKACGYTRMREVLPATGHSWSAPEVDDTDGTITYRCTNDGCTAVRTENHTHTYTQRVVAPTCGSPGYTEYTCACGYSYQDTPTDPTNDHSWGDWQTTQAATCTAEGVSTRSCSKCGATQTESIAKTDHSWGEWETITEATENATGLKKRTCQNTGCTAYEEEVIPKLGTEVELLSNIKTGSWYYASHDLSTYRSNFDTGGYFTVYYTPTESNNGITFGFGWYWSTKVESQATNVQYSITMTYDDIKSGNANNSDDYFAQIGFQAWGMTINKVTWTPASAEPESETESSTEPSTESGTNDDNVNGASVLMLMNLDDDYATSLSDVDSTAALTAPSYVGVVEGGTLYDSAYITADGDMTATWTDLPLYKLDESGNIIGYYTYYVVEVGGESYNATYTYHNGIGETEESSMTGSISDGTIIVTNTSNYGYELPESGGGGTLLYTLGGLALMGLAVLMYNHKKGRKGVPAP